MTPPEVSVQETVSNQQRPSLVNDFSIQVATVNGSGSQTANLVLLRALFRMGVPVSGKNLFPSNIAGLPTWFTIRASKHGYIGRQKEIDLLVAMNPETARDDVQALDPGAIVVFDDPLKLDAVRQDLVFYPVPFDKLVAPVCPDAKLRRLVRNMIYDGVLAKLLDIDLAELERALNKQLARKAKALALNQAALKAGFDYAAEHLEKRDGLRVERMDRTAGKILIEGNAAAALGCMMAGVTVVTWYPITPSSSLCETLTGYMRKYRMDPETGKATFAIVQAEDELSALGMAIGAGWAGARAMTATSGPGVSLMAEFTGLGYYAEVPAVIFDIQRVGPSTGLPTRTAQGDILSTAVLSHGDTKHPMLLPASVEEIYEMAMQAFDLAERLQTPVFVMSDLDLGMNTWMADRFEYPTRPIDRGKVLDAAKVQQLRDWDATPTWTATPSRTARCRETACPRTSAAARGTTNEGSTASGPRTTWATSIGWRGSSRRRASWCPPRRSIGRRAPRSASSGTAPATGRSRKAARSWPRRASGRPICGCAPVRSRPPSRSSSAATRASTSWIRTATRR